MTMTSYERVMAVLTGQRPDCVPAAPVMLMQGARELGMELEEYFSRGEYLAEGQLRLLDRFGHDIVVGVPHVVQDITAFGAGLMYFRDGPPSPTGMVVHQYNDILRLPIPDPLSSPVLVESLAAIELLAREVKGQVPILGACIAPFSLPSMLMGTEAWMELLFFEPPDLREAVMRDVLAITLEFATSWANLQLQAGADAVVVADGMASAAVLNRQQFMDLALPTVRETVARIHGPVIHEGVGHLSPMLDLFGDLGLVAVILTYDDDLARAREIAAGRFSIIGNLNNIEMRRWSPEETARQCIYALETGASGGRLMLANQGPEVPFDVPDHVIHEIVRAAHAWSY